MGQQLLGKVVVLTIYQSCNSCPDSSETFPIHVRVYKHFILGSYFITHIFCVYLFSALGIKANPTWAVSRTWLMIDPVPIYGTVAWLRCYLNHSILLSPTYLSVASWSEGEWQTVGITFLSILMPRLHLKAMSAQQTQANTAFARNIWKYTVRKECVEKFLK